MNALSNQVQLIGHLGSDPEVKQFDKKSRARFSLATNESYKNDQGEWITDTQWHNVVCWGKSTEIVDKILKKGSHVAVTGKLVYRSYEDKEGVKRNIAEIVMKDFMKISKEDKG
jgi:single-strand DNA-binding protein